LRGALRLGQPAMAAPRAVIQAMRMRLYYTTIYQRRDWRRGDEFARRMIELRFTVARAVRDRRRKAKLSQKKLAWMLDSAASTISAIERASPRVTLDQAVRALIVLGADDAAISAAFNPALRNDVQILRRTANRPFFNPLNFSSSSASP
jgi:hypothetical protein